MQKKGQVTYFVLAGLVILLVAGSYYAYQSLRLKTGLETLLAERAQLPQHVQPVGQALDDCAERLTREALATIGAQGGLRELTSDPLPQSSFVPMPSVLEVVPNSDFRVPFWFRERGNGLPEVKIPSKVEVEANIAAILTERFPVCVDELSRFADQGFSFERSQESPEVLVTMSAAALDVVVSYPVVAVVEGNRFTLAGALARVQSQFGRLFETAQVLFAAEMNQTFLENKALDVLVAYDPELPFSGTSFSCGEKVWSKTQVIDRLKAVLFENTAAMRIKGTRDGDDPARDYLTFDLLPQAQRDVSVNLLYSPSWPTLVEITPSQGDLLKGDVVSQKSDNIVSRIVSSFFCLENHHFVYTIKYPVLFTLRGADGSVFQFATEVIIDRNVPRKNVNVPPDVPDTASTLCQFKDRSLRVTTVSMRGDGSVAPVQNVDLAFKCFPTVCPLDAIPLGANSALVQVPRCLNGIVEATKEGFVEGKAVVSTNTDAVSDVTLFLDPVYTKSVEVNVIEKESGLVRPPFASEMVTFQFERLDQGGVHSYFTYQDEGLVCSDDNACGPGLECRSGKCRFRACTSNDACESGQCVAGTCAPQRAVKLAAGEYQIDSFIMRSGTHPLVTQKEVVQKCIDVPAAGLAAFFRTEEKCFTTEIPSVELPSVMVGGASFEHTFSRVDLSSDAPLKLYVLAESPPASLEDFARIQLALQTNHQHSRFRPPEV